MLKGIDNRLNAEVLHALRLMGHGDVLIVADTNFPSDSISRSTVFKSTRQGFLGRDCRGVYSGTCGTR